MPADLLPQSSAALVPVRAGAWVCTKLQIGADDRLSVRFEAPEDNVGFDLDIQKADADRLASRGLTATAISVRGRLELAKLERQREASALVRGIAAGIDGRVALHPDLTLAEALGRDATPRQVRFSRQLVLDMLGPEWQPEARLPGDWRLHDVFPASQLRQTEALTLALELRHADGRRLVLLVGQRGQRQVLAKTAHFDLEHLTLGTDPGTDGAALLTLLCFALQLRDHDGLTIAFPSLAEDVAALPAPEPVAEMAGRMVNLAIPADCGQDCAFCSALAAMPPQDGGSLRSSQLCEELRQARQSGAATVRFNGYDPLAFSGILDVMRYAVSLGLRKAEVWSPCTRLADPTFRAEVLDALPLESRFFVPLYAGTAELHDAYVGRPGAFAQVQAAVIGLREARGALAVSMTSVLTRQNLHELVPMQTLCRQWGVWLTLHLPFPTSESHDDRYFSEAVPFSEMATMLADAWGRHRFRPEVAGLPPCVLWRAMRLRGARIDEWLTVEATRHQPAGAYREEKYHHSADGLGNQDTRVAPIVPCPHASVCALATVCPRNVLRSYVQRFGLAELMPVNLADLLAAG